MNQKLIFEISSPGRYNEYFPETKLNYQLPEDFKSNQTVDLPEVAELDLVRHYTNLSLKTHGVDNVFYPLGSCTMKYNPKLNEDMANLSGFANIHPEQPEASIQGALEAMGKLQNALSEITGMDSFTLQPAAGAQGEFLGMLLIHKYHKMRNDEKRTKVIVPDSAHGTNPASAVMAGFEVVTVASNSEGGVDLDALRALANEETAALMLTNPNTLGLFDKNIYEISEIIHGVGGLLYYDGANLNPIMGLSRPGDMGFDVVHLNLHKTFSTPHGGGGPGSGPVGVKKHLEPYLPSGTVVYQDKQWTFLDNPNGVGRMRSYYGNFLVNIKALTYILTLGKEGLINTAKNAIINANYMKVKLSDTYQIAYQQICMHEFVMSLEKEKQKYNFTAKDISKALLDYQIHPPTMYFPNIVNEALMVEPNETESKETLDNAIEIFKEIHQKAIKDHHWIKNTPYTMPVARVDEVLAARNPILIYKKDID